MLTRCTHCLTWFRVRAEHLSVAGGQVTCGHCDAVFDALVSLLEEDTPPPARRTSEPAAAAVTNAQPSATRTPDTPERPDADAPAADIRATPFEPVEPAVAAIVDAAPAATDETLTLSELPLASEMAPAPPTADSLAPVQLGTDERLEGPLTDETGTLPSAAVPVDTSWIDHDLAGDTAFSFTPFDAEEQAVQHPIEPSPPDTKAPPVAASAHVLSPDEHAILFTAPGSDREVDDTVPEARAVEDQLYDELAALSPPPERKAGPLWFAAGMLLAVALAAQVAWLGRERVERLWPASAPLYARLCTRLACPDTAAPPVIRLVARDVREHPQYRGALLVNATLVNDAPAPQPFPDIELRLHDAGGRTIGARKFAPSEYLDHSIPIADGMPPSRPVYIVMELGGDAASAVSFEFTFL